MNILIVDDHAVVREGYKALLNAMMPDCRIFDAENGAQTHRLLASSDIEILILDINLSNESGLVLAKIFLKRHPDLKTYLFQYVRRQRHIAPRYANRCYGVHQ